MGRRIKKQSTKAGLAPGTLVFVGEKRESAVIAERITYSADSHESTRIGLAACETRVKDSGVTWINIEGLHELAALERIGQAYGLHMLTLEDIVNTDQRLKIEDYGDYLFIVMKMLHLDARTQEIMPEQVSMVLGRDFVLSFQEGLKGDVFDPVRERLSNAQSKLRVNGADHLCYALIDAVVDNYYVILESMGERIETLDEELLGVPTPATLRDIHKLKRELIYLRKSVWPMREVLAILQRGDSQLITQGTLLFLRDVYDHTVQVIDTLETYREMLSAMADVYMSAMSNRLNEIMKVLTIITTVFIPLSFVAGVYGMNFRHMPELGWLYGYGFAWAIMIAIAGGMLVFFRKKKWI